MIRTTWPLFANSKYKNCINRKANNDKLHLFNRNTTQDRHMAKRTNNKQQLNRSYVTTYKTVRHEMHTLKNHEHVTVQHENANNTA